jgi:bla regulator protein blaR1
VSMLGAQVLRKLPLSTRLVVTAFGLLALGGASLGGLAQAPAPPPAAAQTPATSNVTFEVASIKRNKQAEAERAGIPLYVPQVPGRAQTLRGGVLRGRSMTVRELIRDAYGYRNRAHGEIVGAPDWIDKERYDVEAKAATEFPPSTSVGLPPAGEAALRALLAERLNLKVRVEMQRRPVYELVVHRADRRLGPNLVPAKGECRPFFQREAVNAGLVIAEPKDEPQPLRPCPLGVSFMMIGAENMTMTDWVKILALRPQLNRTVIDRTDLTGGFDILLRMFEPDDPAAAANLLPAIKPLLESQLGLTLRDAEAPVEILVIEHVERPSEN